MGKKKVTPTQAADAVSGASPDGTSSAFSVGDTEYDKIAQASLNGIYVKAQEMDRGHSRRPAPYAHPPGMAGDADAGVPDAEFRAGGGEGRFPGAGSCTFDVESHVSDCTGD